MWIGEERKKKKAIEDLESFRMGVEEKVWADYFIFQAPWSYHADVVKAKSEDLEAVIFE